MSGPKDRTPWACSVDEFPAFVTPREPRMLSEYRKAAEAMSEASGLKWTLLHRCEGGFEIVQPSEGRHFSLRFDFDLLEWPSHNCSFPDEDVEVPLLSSDIRDRIMMYRRKRTISSMRMNIQAAMPCTEEQLEASLNAMCASLGYERVPLRKKDRKNLNRARVHALKYNYA
jgi:hypothetical protein